MVSAVSIARNAGKAIYLQIYESILDDIRTQNILPGEQLPTETSLSRQLHVSRNTVGMAYRRLENDGFVVSTPGRGTFVTQDATAISAPASSQRDRITRLLDLAVEEALSVGLTIDAYTALFKKHLSQQKKKIRTSKICLIECNEEQLLIFAEDIRKALGISITPLLLSDFRNRTGDSLRTIANADIIMTSVYHSAEVVSIIPGKRIDILGLQPQLDSLIQIAQLPKDSKIGIVCASKQFLGDIMNTLKESKLSFSHISVVDTEDPAELASRVSGFDAVIASPGRIHDVQKVETSDTPVIEFVYRISSASMNLIKILIVETHRKSPSYGITE